MAPHSKHSRTPGCSAASSARSSGSTGAPAGASSQSTQRGGGPRSGPRLVVISVDPEAGKLLPGDSSGQRLRQYVDDVERVRLVYWVTALKTVVVVAFIEV